MSAPLQQFALEALDLGFGCFSDGDRVPFALIIAGDGQRQLIGFPSVSGTIDAEHLKAVRQIIRETFATAQSYALVWDGYLTSDGSRQDAVCAEAAEHESKKAILFAQAYRQKKRTKALEKIGDVVAVQLITSLLKNRKRRK